MVYCVFDRIIPVGFCSAQVIDGRTPNYRWTYTRLLANMYLRADQSTSIPASICGYRICISAGLDLHRFDLTSSAIYLCRN